MIIISLIFFAIAAICNAVMDILTHKFEKSLFFIEGDQQCRQWYDPSVSWKNKYIGYDPSNGRLKWGKTQFNYPVQLTDAWHLYKTLMIISLAISVVTFSMSNMTVLVGLVMLLVYGTTWNCTFSLFYNKILQNKKLI